MNEVNEQSRYEEYSNRGNPYRTLIIVASVLIVLGLLVYFVGVPQFNKYVEKKEQEAQIYAAEVILMDMITQLKNTGMYRIDTGEGVIILVPYTR